MKMKSFSLALLAAVGSAAVTPYFEFKMVGEVGNASPAAASKIASLKHTYTLNTDATGANAKLELKSVMQTKDVMPADANSQF